jgi:hypothetical protein
VRDGLGLGGAMLELMEQGVGGPFVVHGVDPVSLIAQAVGIKVSHKHSSRLTHVLRRIAAVVTWFLRVRELAALRRSVDPRRSGAAAPYEAVRWGWPPDPDAGRRG